MHMKIHVSYWRGGCCYTSNGTTFGMRICWHRMNQRNIETAPLCTFANVCCASPRFCLPLTLSFAYRAHSICAIQCTSKCYKCNSIAVCPWNHVNVNGINFQLKLKCQLCDCEKRRHNKIVTYCCGSCGLWRESDRKRKRDGETGWQGILANIFIKCEYDFYKKKCWNARRRQWIAL